VRQVLGKNSSKVPYIAKIDPKAPTNIMTEKKEDENPSE
jgi:hypothetical protein